jgi:hypothetical protein
LFVFAAQMLLRFFNTYDGQEGEDSSEATLRIFSDFCLHAVGSLLRDYLEPWRCKYEQKEWLLRQLKKNLLLVKMKEKKLLKMQSLPKVLRSQAMRSTTSVLVSLTTQESGGRAEAAVAPKVLIS